MFRPSLRRPAFVLFPVGATVLAAWLAWGGAGEGPIPAPAPPEVGAAQEFAPDDPAALARAAAQLQGAEAADGPDHPKTAGVRLCLARLQSALGDSKAAGESYAAIERAFAGRGEPHHWLAREAGRRRAELDPADPQVARAGALHARAASALRTGRFLDAVVPAREALLLRESLPGQPRVDVADSLLQVGQAYLNRGEHYRDAWAVLVRARDAYVAAFGTDHPATAACLHEMATLEEDRGDFFTANQLYEQACKLFLATVGERTAEYARTLNRQGRMHGAWRLTFAEGKVMTALAIREQVLGKGHPDYAESLQDLGEICVACFDFDRAARVLADALTVQERTLGPDHPDVAVTLSALGLLVEQTGDYVQARRYHQRALSLMERARGRTHLRFADCLNSAAWLHDQEQDNPRAVRMFEEERVTRLAAGADKHPAYARCLARLGCCFAHIEIWDQYAFASGRQFDKQPDGARLFVRGMNLMEEAVKLFESLPDGTRHAAYADTLAALGYFTYFDGYKYRGLEYVERCLAKAKTAIDVEGMDRHPAALTWLNNRMRYDLAVNDLPGARAHALAYVDLSRRRYSAHHPLEGLVQAWADFEVCDRAGEFTRLVGVAHDQLDRYSDILVERPFCPSERVGVVWLEHVRKTLSTYLIRSIGVEADATRAYSEVLVFRGAVASRQKRDRESAKRPELRPAYDALQQARAALAHHALAPRDPGDAGWRAELQRRSDARDDAETDLSGRCHLLLPHQRPVPLDLVKDVQKALAPGSAVVDYFRIMYPLPYTARQGVRSWEWRLVAFVVHLDRPPVMLQLGPLKAIEEAVRDWRQQIETGVAASAEGKKVRELVWDPLLPTIGTARNLFVVPDGPVCAAPLAALPTDAGGILLEEFTIGYLPSARTLSVADRTAPAGGAGGLLVVGDLDYGEHRATATRSMGVLGDIDPWHALPASALETEAIGKLFSASAGSRGRLQFLTGSQADVPALLGGLKIGVRYLHFAGHGYFVNGATAERAFPDETARLEPGTATAQWQVFNRHSPLLSGLVLAGANTPAGRAAPGRSILTAEQVTGLNLEGTDLVTLSACDTGLGSLSGGEGVMGLQRAFLNAGTRSVTASLWSVDDAATSVLMEEVYTNLWQKKMTKAKALREAQLTVFRHPERVQPRRELVVQNAARRGLKAGEPRVLSTISVGGQKTPPALWAAFVLTGAAD
ncbi:MAG: photosystem assembly protein Ycf3 [Gemmataceae bacterium]|nr:photosystem assembly protein Ycf3 [Gemmataceae bacterium]